MPPKKQTVSENTANQNHSKSRNTRSKGKPEQDAASNPINTSNPKKEPQPKKKVKGSKKEQEEKLPQVDTDKSKPKSQGNQKRQQGKDLSKDKKKGKGEQSGQQKGDEKQPKSEVTGEQKKEDDLKKLILKGTVPVDQYFSKAATFKVYADKDKIYAATLNQSNIDNNNNKFYIIQILVNEKNPNDLVFFTRWGRVGVQGQKSEESVKSVEKAIKDYNKKLSEKSKTYTLVEMNYEENAATEQPKNNLKKDQPQSKLQPAVQDLIRLIFDMKMMANQMKEIGYDAKKMPLGKLAKTSISRGYQILKSLMEEIKKGTSKDETVIKQLSGSFYSEIPHDFGFKNMANFVLVTEQKVKEKLQMLQSLQDIQVFTKLLDQGNANSQINELDSNYAKLNMKIAPLDKNSPTYQLLLKYVANTHASTHTAFKLTVMDIFELEKENEISRYTTHIPNKMLLWHGSRLTNFVGILSQGLRIAPPEAPVTGYMFGKGVYFADMVTKSANYCFTSRENNVGLMLLCEVALGEVSQKFYADYYANLLPEGKKSTKGCGKTAPSAAGSEKLGEVIVPCGEGCGSGINSGSLLYNQFIVYDVAQIKCRYLCKMKFNYA